MNKKVTQKVIPNFRGHTSLDIKSEKTIKEKSLLANRLSAIFIYSFTYLFLINLFLFVYQSFLFVYLPFIPVFTRVPVFLTFFYFNATGATQAAMNEAFTLALCELSLRLLADMEISKFVQFHGCLSSVSLRLQMVYPDTRLSWFTRQLDLELMFRSLALRLSSSVIREATSVWVPSRVIRVACHPIWGCSGVRKVDPGQT